MKNLFTTPLTLIGSLSLAALSLAFATPAKAVVVAVDWTTGTTGTLNGTDVNLTNIGSSSIDNFDLSGPNYSAAPLSSSQESVVYDVGNSWTATFASPISNLLLYPVFWRGIAANVDPVTYTFT